MALYPLERALRELGIQPILATNRHFGTWQGGLAPGAAPAQPHYLHCTSVMPFSRGWRRTSRTWRVHSGRSSRKSVPWCASDTSPGIGSCQPPISPTSEMV
jgi:hypothetical protein